MLKNRLWFKTFLLSLFATIALFSNCSVISETENDSVTKKNGDYEVLVSLDSETMRTIIPTAISPTGVASYKLTGTSLYGTTVEETYTPAQITSGTTKLILAATIWSLKLEAYGTTDVLAVGYKNVDFTNSAEPIKFSLSPISLTGNGSAKITVNFSNPTLTATKATLGLYQITSNASFIVVEYGESDVENGQLIFDRTGIPAGNYIFKAFFYTTAGKQCGYYSDSIFIEQGRITESTINVGTVIETKPAAPSDFHVYYIEGSESADGSTYQAKFEWKDNSYNERYFEIRFNYGTNEQHSDDYFYISALSGESVVHPTFALFECPESYLTAVSGSVMAGSTGFTAKLRTGYFYEVEICAVNNIGKSDYIPRTAGTDRSGLKAYGKSVYIGQNGFSATQSINRVRVIYDLRGGTLYTDTRTSTENIIEFYTAGVDTPTLYALNKYVESASNTKPYLLLNGVSWNHWAKDSSGAIEMTASGFTHQNQVIYAIYEGGG